MKKINLLGQSSSGSSESTTITNLGLIYLKPLLDIEPTRETQELFPGDDGVSGYSFIRIKGVNNQEKEATPSKSKQVITPDEGYVGLDSVTINGVDNTIDSNIKPENIKHGVEILGTEGTYAPVTKPIEITPTTQEQVEVPGMGVDGFDSVTVKAVTSDIDSNIKPENIVKGVSILGVEGDFKSLKRQTKDATYDTPGDYTLTPDEGYNISSANIKVLEEALPDQLRYDLAIDYNSTCSPTFTKAKAEFTEDGNFYILFCNAEGNPAQNLVGFSYTTSYVAYSYHRYDESYFKEKDGFIYLNTTKLGGPNNSTGIHVGYLFKDHKIPDKFLYNCACFRGICIGANCRNVGNQAFVLDTQYQDYIFSYFIARANNNSIRYGVAYTLNKNQFTPDIYRTVTIDPYVQTDYTPINVDVNDTSNYHIYHKYSGRATDTDDTDSSYVDITVYKYKRILANYDITKELSAVYSQSESFTGVIWKGGSDTTTQHKIIVHDNKTYLYLTHVHDSSFGGLIWLLFNKDNPTIPDFGFYGIDALQDIAVYKPLTLGCCAYFSNTFNGKWKHSFESITRIHTNALSLFGFNAIHLLANNYNYATAYVNDNSSLLVDALSYSTEDQSARINNAGIITCDLSGDYYPGNFNNSNYNNFNGPNYISSVAYIDGTTQRKWMNNTMYDNINYIDNNSAGSHMYEFDLPEQPYSFYAQRINLNNIGQTINGNKMRPYWMDACYNIMVSHNIDKFECTLGLDKIYNKQNKTINICVFCDPSKVTINHSTTSPLNNEYTINVYTNSEFSDISSLKTMIDTNFSGITVNYDTFSIVFDTLQNQTLEAGNNYGFVHSSRTRHSLLKL